MSSSFAARGPTRYTGPHEETGNAVLCVTPWYRPGIMRRDLEREASLGNIESISEQIADVADLGPQARHAWRASLSVRRGVGAPSFARTALAAAIRSKAPRIMFLLSTSSRLGARWSVVIGRPCAQPLLQRETARDDLLPLHAILRLEAASGPVGAGCFLVLLPSRTEVGEDAKSGPSLGFELLNTWEARVHLALRRLSRWFGADLAKRAGYLLTIRRAFREAVIRAIASHERGHMDPAWPIWPSESASVRAARTEGRRRGDDTVRVTCNALGDLIADLFGPASDEVDCRLVTLAYHLDNLRRGTPTTDADCLNATLIFRPLSARLRTPAARLDVRGLDDVFDELRATARELAERTLNGRMNLATEPLDLPPMITELVRPAAAAARFFRRSLTKQRRFGTSIDRLTQALAREDCDRR